MPSVLSPPSTTCFHCGELLGEFNITSNDKQFCCKGCQTVHDIINKNGLCNYYDITANPGTNQKATVRKDKFGYLDNEAIQKNLIHFNDSVTYHVKFYLPQIHCSSCIWILEKLNKIDSGILRSQVDFIKKEINVIYDSQKTTLRKVAETLTLIGYEPHINLKDVSEKKNNDHNRTHLIKIGVAGFCFANIMMLSFPEYFSLGEINETSLKKLFSFLIFFLSLPVIFFSASEFFTSAWNGLKQRFLNIDAPIALAIIITFSRSAFEILTDSGAGYLDSMTGIVFFMLIGRHFQNRTYQTISFDRDYTSYFPLGVTVITEAGEQKQTPVSDLKAGHRIKIHNEEIIPVDAILFFGKANIDYSFVTGESLPVEKGIGEIIYAGGKQIGEALELEVVKEVSQSYLTQLWNNAIFKEKKEEKQVSFIHAVSKYFTITLFSLAALTAIYWSYTNAQNIWPSVTAILIVACPCALLLSATFTNGNMIRILSRHRFYVKNSNVIERIAEANTIVFDKTGTITKQNGSSVKFEGNELSSHQKQMIRTLVSQSNHPLSRSLVSFLPFSKNLPINEFKEIKGSGVSAVINDQNIKIGSAEFVFGKQSEIENNGSRVYISFDGKFCGYFTLINKYREGFAKTIEELKPCYEMFVLSGDNDSEKEKLRSAFGKSTVLLFDQKPTEKMEFIKELKHNDRKIIMVGDGINDAGALKQSDAGIAISDDINNFSPACDAILAGENFHLLKDLIDYCKKEKVIIYSSFIVSICYNIIGLYFAAQGLLEPVIAAILMPLSSISIVLLTTGMSNYYGRKLKRKDMHK